mmetsp:Transcript_35886/g.55975  ORF Transcript_35886/g.55975 Transcript_35886/m.55975 type:complete len:85 (+) Transcript_35886:301-555(+)
MLLVVGLDVVGVTIIILDLRERAATELVGSNVNPVPLEGVGEGRKDASSPEPERLGGRRGGGESHEDEGQGEDEETAHSGELRG